MMQSDPMRPALFRVAGIGRELADTFTLNLIPTSGPDFSFLPGQFNMVYSFAQGEVPISISGDPEQPATLVHTIRAVGAVTESLKKLKKGHMVGIRGPFGTPWPIADAEGDDVVVVAGGLGLAPIRPAIYHLLNHRNRFGSVRIYYGARSPAEILFEKELHQWRSRFDLFVDVTVDRAMGDWAGRVGVVTELLKRGGYDPSNTTALVCGPEIMMRYAVNTLLERGVSPEKISLSMERNMKCAIGFCGHCQLGPGFVCRDGPVYPFDKIQRLLEIREI
jgi:NAD(P)H-flavin reductase